MDETPVKSRRRFLRFSLRTLFVAMTVFGIWFAAAMSPWATVARVTEALSRGDLDGANRFCNRSRVEFSDLQTDGSFVATVVNPRNGHRLTWSYNIDQFARVFQGSRRSLGDLLTCRLSTPSGSVLFGHFVVTGTDLSFEPETY